MKRPAPRADRARRFTFVVAGTDEGRRLDDFLNARIAAETPTPPSRSDVRRCIIAGAVSIQGRPTRRPGQPVHAGTRVEARFRIDAVRTRPEIAALGPAQILYEDAWLLAVDKPPALPTVATADARRPHLVGLVARHLSPTDPAAAYVGVHQRLDRDTSGVVLFTKDPAANPSLARAFAEHAVRKVYIAWTQRPARLPRATWRVTAPVDGAAAVTDFTRLEVRERALLVEARPHTGRKHQIRIHLAAGGLPILGDERYGAGRADANVPRLMLHAAALTLPHPITGRALTIESRVPDDFRRVAERLGR